MADPVQAAGAHYLPTPESAPAAQTELEVRYAAAAQSITRPDPAIVRTASVSLPTPPAFRREAPQAPAASGNSRFVVQLGAFSSEEAAAKAWINLTKRFAYLSGLNKSVSPATVDSGKVYRLRAVAGTTANAQSLCGKLRVAGENCVVVR